MTGGGQMPSVKLDPIDEMLLSVVNEKSVNGLENMFDSDNQTKIIKPLLVEYILEVSQNTEITNAESSKTEENESLGQNEEDMPTVSIVAESSNGGKKNWRKYTPTDLQLPTTSALKPKGDVHGQTERTNGQKSTSRRRPTQSISTLTSSQVAAKYNLLLDRRLVLIEKQIQSIDDEQEFLKTERKLKIELLKVKVAYEKSSMLVSCSNKEI